MKIPNRIAMLPQGGQGWIAGVIYNHNLIRALHQLPDNERPRVDFLLGAAEQLSYHKELGDLHPDVYYYHYKESTSLNDKFYQIRYNLLRLKWPVSLEALALRLKSDILFPAQGSLGKDFPVPWIGWIPDFQHKHYPQYFAKEELKQRDLRYARLLCESWHTVVSSQDSLEDLKRFYPGFENKTSVLSFCSVPVEEWYQENPQAVVRKFNVPEKFLIFPSQFWIHKNHQVVLKALAILKENGFSDVALVCTGFTQDYRQPEHFVMLQNLIEQNGLQKNVFILGLLERVEQIQLMRMAVAVIQPSLFEGWSSLVEDARALGKKIFVSDIPIHREQDPPDAFFFLPDDVQMLANQISSQWNHWSPGPDREKEKTTLIAHRKRVVSYARNFLKIAAKTI